MRALTVPLATLLFACSPAPKPAEPPKPDPTKEAAYVETVSRLTELHQQAQGLRKRRKNDEAAALILEAQPLIARVLAVPRPTLAAMEIASDLDDLYGRMLMANRHYGPARLMFQKNVARWTHWRPQTAETERRRKAAEAAIREADSHIEQ
jgi:hypothetical protein